MTGWNTQLLARRAGASRTPLDSDAEVDPNEEQYMLLWRIYDKKPAPFSLTTFALSLVSWPTNADPIGASLIHSRIICVMT